jgi:hypothetical protein
MEGLQRICFAVHFVDWSRITSKPEGSIERIQHKEPRGSDFVTNARPTLLYLQLMLEEMTRNV